MSEFKVTYRETPRTGEPVTETECVIADDAFTAAFLAAVFGNWIRELDRDD